jgi:hypothetical protein
MIRILDRESAVRAIAELGEDDLRFVNRLVVDRLNLLAQARSTALLADFHVGQDVRFTGPDGRVIRGRIQRLNKKTASLVTADGERWNVAPGLLVPEEG